MTRVVSSLLPSSFSRRPTSLLHHCLSYFYLDQSGPSYCTYRTNHGVAYRFDVFFPGKTITGYRLVDIFGANLCKEIYRQDCDWLISDLLQDDVAKVDIIVTAIKTDHYAITLEIDSADDQQRGPSFWKFNNSLLDDILFVEHLRKNFPICGKMKLIF